MAGGSNWTCRACAFKHLAQAQVVYGELMNGYGATVLLDGNGGEVVRDQFDASHLAKFLGHMSEAEGHAQFLDPVMAQEIRKQRLIVWDAALMKVWSVVDIPFLAWLNKLLAGSVNEVEAPPPAELEDRVDGSPTGIAKGRPPRKSKGKRK